MLRRATNRIAVTGRDAPPAASPGFQGCALPEFLANRRWLEFREYRYRASPDCRACNKCRDRCPVAARTAAAEPKAAQPLDVSRRREWRLQPDPVPKSADVAAPLRLVSLHQEKNCECSGSARVRRQPRLPRRLRRRSLYLCRAPAAQLGLTKDTPAAVPCSPAVAWWLELYPANSRANVQLTRLSRPPPPAARTLPQSGPCLGL